MTPKEPLPLRISQGEREPAEGLLRRISARNGCSAQEFCRDLGLHWQGIRDGQPTAIEALARLAGCAPDALAAWTPRRIDPRTLLFRGLTLRASHYVHDSGKICPACLDDDIRTSGDPLPLRPSSRADWNLSFVTSCARHRCRLERRSALVGDAEGARHTSKSVSVQLSAFELWVEGRLHGRTGASWLDQHEFQAALDLCLWTGQRLAKENVPQSKRTESAGLIAAGFNLLSPGPDRLREALSQWHEQHSGYANRPAACFGTVYAGLKRTRAQAAYATFRDIVTDHAFRTMPLAAGTEVLGAHLNERRFHSVQTAARAAGCTAGTLRTIIARTSPLGLGTAQLSKQGALIPVAIIAPLLQKIRSSISTQRLLREVSLRQGQLASLRDAGLLSPRFETKDLRLWDRGDAHCLLGQVTAEAERIEKPAPGWSDFGRALKENGLDFGASFALILATRKPRLALRGDRKGFAALMVREEDIVSLRGGIPRK